MKERQIVINVQTVAQSIASDGFSFAVASVLIGIGVYVESSAMQWLGFVLFFVMMFARSGPAGVYRVKTFEEARKILDEIEAAQ